MRILLIEDETALRRDIDQQLRQHGHVVDATGRGEEAVYLGQEYPIDVAVVDLGLPDLDGIEVIRRWRAAERRFPILILTARGRWQDKVDGLEAGLVFGDVVEDPDGPGPLLGTDVGAVCPDTGGPAFSSARAERLPRGPSSGRPRPIGNSPTTRSPPSPRSRTRCMKSRPPRTT